MELIGRKTEDQAGREMVGLDSRLQTKVVSGDGPLGSWEVSVLEAGSRSGEILTDEKGSGASC